MKKLKPLDYEILSRLIQDSRISDRQLAKDLRVSQPTVSRRRANIEKELADGYTIIPKFEKIGFEIAAFTSIKGRTEEYLKPGKMEQAVEEAKEWFIKQPNVIFASGGEGRGFDGIFVSFHKSYSEYAKFKRTHDLELSKLLINSESFIVSINSPTILKPFHLKYLAEAVRALNIPKKEG